MKHRILVATTNPGKMRELSEMLAELADQIEWLSLKDFPKAVEVEEDGATFAENAAKKAVGYAKQAGLWTLADDSVLVIDALGGQPGVHSARFAAEGNEKLSRHQQDLKNNQKVLSLLKDIRGVPGTDRWLPSRQSGTEGTGQWPGAAGVSRRQCLSRTDHGVIEGLRGTTVFQRHGLDLPVGPVITTWSPALARKLALHPWQFVSISHRSLDNAAIHRLRRLGLKVLVFTVNAPKRMHELVAAGADGIFTDNPSLAVRELSAATGRSNLLQEKE